MVIKTTLHFQVVEANLLLKYNSLSIDAIDFYLLPLGEAMDTSLMVKFTKEWNMPAVV